MLETDRGSMKDHPSFINFLIHEEDEIVMFEKLKDKPHLIEVKKTENYKQWRASSRTFLNSFLERNGENRKRVVS